jgi:hypothetical protein
MQQDTYLEPFYGPFHGTEVKRINFAMKDIQKILFCATRVSSGPKTRREFIKLLFVQYLGYKAVQKNGVASEESCMVDVAHCVQLMG